MNKIGDRLDFVDKSIEMRNYYIQSEMEKIKNEIQWMDSNSDSINQLRLYFVDFFG